MEKKKFTTVGEKRYEVKPIYRFPTQETKGVFHRIGNINQTFSNNYAYVVNIELANEHEKQWILDGKTFHTN